MVEKKIVEKDFISYLDDDNTTKNQWVIIIKKDEYGVEFKFNSEEIQTIFIPWLRVLKIKQKGDKDE